VEDADLDGRPGSLVGLGGRGAAAAGRRGQHADHRRNQGPPPSGPARSSGHRVLHCCASFSSLLSIQRLTPHRPYSSLAALNSLPTSPAPAPSPASTSPISAGDAALSRRRSSQSWRSPPTSPEGSR